MPFKFSAEKRMRIYIRDGGLCRYGDGFVQLDEMDIDHVVPRAYGGTHDDSNLACSHKSCNRRAGQRMRQPGASGLPHSEGGRW